MLKELSQELNQEGNYLPSFYFTFKKGTML